LDGSRKTLHGTRNGFFFINSKLRKKKVVVNLIHLQVGDRQTEGLDAL
jgi:hypothetical protein